MTTCVLRTLYLINKLNKFLCGVVLLCNVNVYIVIHYIKNNNYDPHELFM
jgi:hypothetical protein